MDATSTSDREPLSDHQFSDLLRAAARGKDIAIMSGIKMDRMRCLTLDSMHMHMGIGCLTAWIVYLERMCTQVTYNAFERGMKDTQVHNVGQEIEWCKNEQERLKSMIELVDEKTVRDSVCNNASKWITIGALTGLAMITLHVEDETCMNNNVRTTDHVVEKHGLLAGWKKLKDTMRIAMSSM